MKHYLQPHHLEQEVSVTLPLGALLRLGNGELPGASDAPVAALREKTPTIGEHGLYGIYVGNARGYNGEPNGILEVLEERPGRLLSWEMANEWAKSVGGRLPTRREAALLFANVPELFEEKSYWTCEQFAGGEAYAWTQDFDYGHQYNCSKLNELRARAVRRLPFPE